MRCLLLLLVASCTLIGCASHPPTDYALGRTRTTSRMELWVRTLGALAEAGYDPEESDRRRGLVLVPSRAAGGRQRFRVQLFDDGWVQVGLEWYRSDRSRALIPPALADEHRALSMRLHAALVATPSRGPR